MAYIKRKTGVRVRNAADLIAKALSAEETKIIALYRGYLERKERPLLGAIAREVFGKTGGYFYDKVKRTIASYEGVQFDDLDSKIAEHMKSMAAPVIGETSKR